jgi:hypothetical protein
LLYTNKLEKFFRKDIPYSPHIAVGHFGASDKYDLKDPKAVPLDGEKYDLALRDIKNAQVDLKYTATELEIIGVDNDYKKSWTIEKFKFGKNWGEL